MTTLIQYATVVSKQKNKEQKINKSINTRNKKENSFFAGVIIVQMGNLNIYKLTTEKLTQQV